jgi:hypothetical protein
MSPRIDPADGARAPRPAGAPLRCEEAAMPRNPLGPLSAGAAVLLLLAACAGFLSEDERRCQESDRRWQEFAAKLPPTARVVVPDFHATANINPGAPPETRRQLQDVFAQMTRHLRDEAERDLLNRGVKVVNREALPHAEQEIVYSQTGVVDLNTAARFGKAVGATHIVLGRVEMAVNSPSHRYVTANVKVIETESLLLVGSFACARPI